RQMWAASGVPGNAFWRQSAKAQSVPGIVVTPLRTPRFDSCSTEINVAFVVSKLAGVRPDPGSDWVSTSCGMLTKRANTGPVIEDPSAFFATGTLIASWLLLTDPIGISPCQPLHKYTFPIL